ncbi:uncharacterized [Tachysurus ichikawai]
MLQGSKTPTIVVAIKPFCFPRGVSRQRWGEVGSSGRLFTRSTCFPEPVGGYRVSLLCRSKEKNHDFLTCRFLWQLAKVCALFTGGWDCS